LPTLRPIWVIVRGKKAGKAELNVPQIRPAVKNPQKNRSPYSWALSMLKSKAEGEEGSQTFTSRTYITSGNSSKGLIEEQQQTRMGTPIPLSHVEAKQSNDLANTTTGNSWNTEREERTYSRDGV
jgi:hypothetical protein